MNLSTNSNERIVLGNLSNSNTNFFTGSNTKNRSNSFLAPSKKKVHVDTPFPNKSVPKVNLSGIDKNDPENALYISRIFGANNEENSPIQKKATWKENGSINRPKLIEIKKPKVMMLMEVPVYEDTVNKKRQLEIEEDEEEKVDCRFGEIETRFGSSYKIPDVPADLMEDRLEEKLNACLNNVSFADTFQTFNNEKASEEEPNIYGDFPIDLSFGDGKGDVII